LQAEQAEAERRAATGVLAQAGAAENPRQGIARKGLVHRCAARSGQGRPPMKPAPRLNRAERFGRTHQQLFVLLRRWFADNPRRRQPRH